jgi:hypothetical protein
MFNNLILARTILSDWSGGLTDHVISNIETDSSVINFGYDVTPFSAIIEPGIAGTNFFTNRSGTIRRNLFSDLTIDQTVNIIGLDIPGRFNFYYPPPDLTGSPGILGTDSSYQQYYRSIYRKGAFQEFVKKERDFRGPPNLIIGDSTTSLTVGTGPTILSVDSTRNTLTCGQSVAIIHDSTTQMSGIFIAYEPATKNLFTSIDSSTGSGTYSDWTVEAYSGQFPLNQTTSPGHICDRWVQDTLQPLYEDLRRVCSSSTDSSNIYRSYSIILANRMWSPRWSWENYAGVTPDRTNSGDLYTFSLDTSGYSLTDVTTELDPISLWKGENNTADSIGSNPLIISGDVDYGIGAVGNCFQLHVTPHPDGSLDSGLAVLSALPTDSWEIEFYWKRDNNPGDPVWEVDMNVPIVMLGGITIVPEYNSGNPSISLYMPDASVLHFLYELVDQVFTKITVKYLAGTWHVFINTTNELVCADSPIFPVTMINAFVHVGGGTFHFDGIGRIDELEVSKSITHTSPATVNSIQVFQDGTYIPGAIESLNINPVIGGSYSDASIQAGLQSFIIEPSTADLTTSQHIVLMHDSSNYLDGTVVSYNSGDLTASIISSSGSGSYSSWSLQTYNPRISLHNNSDYWDITGNDVPTIGTEFKFNYYYNDGTAATSTQEFGISYWQLPRAPITDGSGALAGINNVQVFLDGTWVQNAVIYLEPLTGNIELNAERSFWIDSSAGRIPTQDQTLSFQYYTGNSEYYMLLDDPGYILDDQVVLDADSSTGNSAPIATPLLLGYKFRADLLEHASVLNSGVWNEETYSWEGSTLLLNNYQKPATRASFANQQDSLNHYNYFFSPEFLSDPNPKKILNDQYLDQNINCDADFTSNGVPQGYPVGSTEAVLQLHAGTPPFQKTYSYQPQMIEHRKLKDVRMHHHPLMYADLLIKETTISGDPEVAMSSICDSAPIGIGLGFKDGPVTINECEPWLIMDDPDSILDDVYVFPEFCYNGYKMDATTFYQEYINFLSDYGDGITFKYLNKDTYEVEEHTFSGPVFETYDADQDEVSAIESFPNALIRITKPLNPLTILEDYKFLQDPAIRIRKKTLRELLPDRTFRTFKLYEALPV